MKITSVIAVAAALLTLNSCDDSKQRDSVVTSTQADIQRARAEAAGLKQNASQQPEQGEADATQAELQRMREELAELKRNASRQPEQGEADATQAELQRMREELAELKRNASQQAEREAEALKQAQQARDELAQARQAELDKPSHARICPETGMSVDDIISQLEKYTGLGETKYDDMLKTSYVVGKELATHYQLFKDGIETIRDYPYIPEIIDQARRGPSSLPLDKYVKTFIAAGADVDAYHTTHLIYGKRTALMDAAELRNVELVKLLLSLGASKSLMDAHGETALDLAKETHQYENMSSKAMSRKAECIKLLEN